MYRQTRPIRELIPLERTRMLGREITSAVGDRLWLNIRANTPVAHAWETGGLSQGEIAGMRGGRAPGTLRKSIYRLPVISLPASWSVTVATDDPIAKFVEWDTPEHWIYPRHGSVLAWHNIKMGGVMAFAARVHHPGTHGQHMFSIGALITEAEVELVARPLVDAWALGSDFGGALAGSAMMVENVSTADPTMAVV